MSNIYKLIDALLQEHEEQDGDHDDGNDTVGGRSTIFSEATPLCFFDDGSVTVGEKNMPFLRLCKKPATRTSATSSHSSSTTSTEIRVDPSAWSEFQRQASGDDGLMVDEASTSIRLSKLVLNTKEDRCWLKELENDPETRLIDV